MVKLHRNAVKTLLVVLTEVSASTRNLPDVVEIIESLEDQVEHGDHTGTMLDQVANLLLNVTVRSTLSAEYIGALRKILLTPREMAVVKQPRHVVCVRCGERMVNGEAATISGTDLYCTACIPPSVQSCRNCGQTTTLSPDAFQQLLAKNTCPCQRTKETLHETF